jgi:Family of unknown function (DUF6496)
MPKQRTIERARRAKRAGKSASTQAGEFVREEIRSIRRGKHGARSPQQAIAIGLSEARRAGVALPPPRKGRVKKSTRKSAEYAYEAGQGKRTTRRRPRVSRAVSKVLKAEPRSTVSRAALSRHAKAAAARRRKAGQITPPAPSRKKKSAARRPARAATPVRRPAPRKRVASPAVRRPAPAGKPAARRRRASAYRSVARRPAPITKFTARRVAAASKSVTARRSGPSAAERAAARKAVAARKRRATAQTRRK